MVKVNLAHLQQRVRKDHYLISCRIEEYLFYLYKIQMEQVIHFLQRWTHHSTYSTYHNGQNKVFTFLKASELCLLKLYTKCTLCLLHQLIIQFSDQKSCGSKSILCIFIFYLNNALDLSFNPLLQKELLHDRFEARAK